MKNELSLCERAYLHLCAAVRRFALPLASFFAVGFLAHMYAFTNKLLNADETAALFSKGATVTSGRWGLEAVKLIFPDVSMPWIYGVISLALIAAAVCHVDAAKGMVAWGKDNAAATGLSQAPIRWIVDDCAKFVEREIRRGRRYDAIIMDPPSYGRGPGGEVWKLETNLWPFVSLCAGVLSDDPLFVIINSYTTGLSASVLSYVTESIFTKKFGGRSDAQELGLPVTESGLCLPCGATCRWER